MIKNMVFIFLIIVNSSINGQGMDGNSLLDASIKYHDPQNIWPAFNGGFTVTMETPKNANRVSKIEINLPKQLFKLTVNKDLNTIEQIIEGQNCSIQLNGKSNYSEEDAKKHRLSCDRAKVMRDYYTYLYGLPMKLKDPGTHIDPKIQSKKFKGKEYLVLKVTYDENVGDDSWYFYFDPQTFAMEVYQFYHEESENDGEYILLSGESIVNEIKMPTTRAWYYNKDDVYLGTDRITSTSKE